MDRVKNWFWDNIGVLLTLAAMTLGLYTQIQRHGWEIERISGDVKTLGIQADDAARSIQKIEGKLDVSNSRLETVIQMLQDHEKREQNYYMNRK